MQLTTRQTGDVVIADLSGRLAADGGTAILRDRVSALMDQGKCRIVINLAGIEMVGSDGIPMLVAAKRSAQAAGGDVKLLNVAAEVKRVLQLAGVLSSFQVFSDEGSAVSSFG